MTSLEQKIADYIKERYADSLSVTPAQYISGLNAEDAILIETDSGFASFNLEGDAVLIYDMYIVPQARLHGKAWELFDTIKKVAEGFKKRCLITFSEQVGQNHNLGLEAISAAGFVQYGQVGGDKLFIRGV